jgi:hypothetical protein
MCFLFIGAAFAVGALTASVVEAGSAANALAPKVAAKTPANNDDNSLFMIESFNKKIKWFKCVTFTYLTFTSVVLALGENNFLIDALMPVSFLAETLVEATLVEATLASTLAVVEAIGAAAGFAASAAKALTLKLPAIKPTANTDKNLFILTSPNPYKINFVQLTDYFR